MKYFKLYCLLVQHSKKKPNLNLNVHEKRPQVTVILENKRMNQELQPKERQQRDWKGKGY